MAARFDQQLQIVRQNLSTGAAQGLQSLAGEFQRFSDQKVQEFQQEQAKIAVRQGQEAFTRGEKPVFADENVFLGRKNAIAYNKGLEHSYLSSLSNDIRGGLAEAETANQADLLGYQNAAKAFMKGTMSEVDPRVALRVQQSFEEQITLGSARVSRRQFDEDRKEQRAISDQNIDTLAKTAYDSARGLDMTSVQQVGAELNAALESGITAGLYKQSEVNKLKQNIATETTIQGKLGELEQVMDQGGIDAGIDFLRDVQDTDITGLSTESKKQLMTRLAARISTANSQRVQALQNRDAETLVKMNNLIVESQRPGADKDAIIAQGVEMFNNEDMSAGELGRLFNNLNVGAAKQQEDDEEVAKVIARFAFEGQQISQKGVDMYYARHMETSVTNAPTPHFANAEVAEFARTHRMIPTQYQQQIANDISTGEPELVARAVDFIDRIDDIPGIDPFDKFSKQERAFAMNVLALSQNMPPEKAIEIARQNTTGATTAMVEARNEQIGIWNRPGKNNKDFKNYTEIVRDEFDTRPGGINEGLMAKEYKDTFESLYRLGTPEEAAADTARRIVSTNWKEDVVTGKTYKYPVSEFVTDYGRTQKDMVQSITQAIEEGKLTSATGVVDFKPEMEDIIIYSDDRTAREAALGTPSYLAAVVHPETGELLNLSGFRWAPPYADMQRDAGDLDKQVEVIRNNSRLRNQRNIGRAAELNELSSLGVL